MSGVVKVALVQPTSAKDPAANLAWVGERIREARAAGAEFILTPECVLMMNLSRAESASVVQPEAGNTGLAGFQDLARETGAWLMAGSLSIKLEEDGRLANRSYLLAPDGSIAAWYDKIHMFDVDVGDGKVYRESKAYRPGERAVLADLPWGRVGLSICYDLRFPYLYRGLAHAGANILTVPAAFTRVTGEAHWHVLLRARAIETGCFVLAPAQCGDHEDGRQTFGHSLIVAPWGEVIADGGTEPGIVYGELDMSAVAEARRKVPSLTHDREIAFPAPETVGLALAGE